MSFDGVLDVLRASPSLVPLALFVVALGEAVVFTSPLVPATVLLLGMGGLHKAADGQFATIVAAATAGTFIGDVASYAIGRVYRDRIGGWWPMRSNPTWLPAALTFMRKWGLWGLVASKFLGPVRWFGPTVCGVLSMPVGVFLIVTAAASVLWSVVLLAPLYYGTGLIAR